MKRLLLSAAAVAVIAVPGLSLADPNHDQKDEHRPPAAARQAPQQHQARPSAPQGGMNQRFAPQQSRGAFTAPTRVNPQQNYQRQPQYGVQRSAPSQGQWNRSRGGNGYVQPGQTTRQGQYNGYRNGGVQGQYNGYRNGGVQGRYNGYRNGGVQGQNSWRGQHASRGQNWWRGQRGFERYEGRRDGYWFAPGWGYYQPDAQYYNYDWEVGGIVPYDLRGYYISDPYAYGLPPAPYGCEWIFLGDEMVLIDLQSGQIVELGDSY